VTRSLRISTGLRRSIRAARDSGQVGPSFEVFAAIAGKLADTCDKAADAGDARELVATSRLLMQVLAAMGLGPPAPAPAEPEGGGSGDGSAGGPDAAAVELAELLRSGPQVGHAADAGAPHLRAAGGADR